MSTFSGIVEEFPRIRIDNFRHYENHQPPLACFLSHIHSDHLMNLENIKAPFVYCTAATRELLLRLERYPHRMNFNKGILEVRKQTYRKVKRLLKPMPLETPTVIELTHGYSIQVTLFDANHCTGACMFLIEGGGKAVLYTGDVRSEPWWVDSLIRNPVIIPYSKGAKHLDTIYLDTTFATGDSLGMDFPTKADGLAELLKKVGVYPKDTVFYLDAWTFGYEDVWIALCNALGTKVHLCDYRYRVYSSMKGVPECFGPHSAALLGYQLGNSYHEGCLTKEDATTRLHSCERGTYCEVFKNPDVVRITPIVTRYKDLEIAEMGAGGGQGDLDQKHELELSDVMAVSQLINLCRETLRGQPQLHAEIVQWLRRLSQTGHGSVKLDFDGFWDDLRGSSGGVHGDDDVLDDIPLDRLVPALANLVMGKPKASDATEAAATTTGQSKQITFPFSRHSSYRELRHLVSALMPRDVHPCTIDQTTWTPAVSMKTLFGDLCSADIFKHDEHMYAVKNIDQNTAAEESSLSSAQEAISDSPEPSCPEMRKRGRTGDGTEKPDLRKRQRPADRIPAEERAHGLVNNLSSSTTLLSSARIKKLAVHEPVTTLDVERHNMPSFAQGAGALAPQVPSCTPNFDPGPGHDKRDGSSRAARRLAQRRRIVESLTEGGNETDGRDTPPWRGLTSVNGYSRQGKEEEL